MNTETEPATADETVTINIYGLAVGGAAVGRVIGPEDSPRIGMTAFVPLAGPGENISATIRRAYPRYIEAELLEVLSENPDRVEPPCPYFGKCGGCDIQHLRYPAQIAAKQAMIQGALRSAGLSSLLDKLGDAVVSSPFHYRQRTILHIGQDGEVGYYRRHSHSVLSVASCPISVPEINRFLENKIALVDIAPVLAGAELHIESGENGIFVVVKASAHLTERQAKRILERLKPYITGGMVEAEGRTIAQFGEEGMLRKLAGMVQEEAEGAAAPGVFSQINPSINEQLVSHVVQIAESAKIKTALDLYAGAGNFSLPLAARGIRVTAVEAAAALVATGRAEATRRGWDDLVNFQKSDVVHYLRKTHRPVDLIIADPPRAGLAKLTGQLNFAPHLIMISCHLPSGVRDIQSLQSNGWQVESITPFDMFPQTAHIELMTYLRR